MSGSLGETGMKKVHTFSADEVNNLYNRSKIVLGSPGGHWPYSSFLTDLKPRDFEIPMSGAFYACLYNPELRDYYQLGKEIVCFKNNEDMLLQIKKFLNNSELRNQIKEAGYKRAIEFHEVDRSV